MSKVHFFVAVLALSVLNGLYNPFVPVIWCSQLVSLLVPEMFHGDGRWLLYFNALFVSTLTLFLSGVPAALYERLWLGERDSVAQMIVWLAGAALLSVPAFQALRLA
jgi:hypothetical protein